MNSTKEYRSWLACILLGSAICSAAAAEECANVIEISPGNYLRPGEHVMQFESPNVANIGFIVGERCVAVVDTGGSAQEGRELSCAITRATDLPVCYVINTHAHPDHILGNQAFTGNAANFVGHEHLARALGIRGPTWLERAAELTAESQAKPELIPPDIEISDSHTLDLGGRELRITAMNSAHTNSDLMVFDSTSGTVWLGDLLFVEHVPVIDASLLGWVDVMNTLANQSFERAVPGHGPVQTDWSAALKKQQRFLETLRDETRGFLAQDGRLKNAAKTIGQSERKAWQLFDEFHVRNVSAAYTELEWED